MPVLLSEPLKTYYYFGYCSFPFIIMILFIILSIVLSYMSAYYTGRFYINNIIESVNPDVKFEDQYILQIQLGDTLRYYSSIIKFNDMYNNLLSVPFVKIKNQDFNEDGLLDEININIKFPIDTENIKNVKLYFFTDYIIDQFNKIAYFPGMNFIDIDTPNGVSYLKTVGKLKFIQKYPLSTSKTVTSSKTSSISLVQNMTSPIEIKYLMEEYLLSNFTTTYEYAQFIYPYKSSDLLEINMKIEIPVQESIIFNSPFLLSLKNAWIEFLCILIPMSLIFYFLYMLAIKSGIFSSQMIIEKPS